MQSISNKTEDRVDCRLLRFEGSYFQLDDKQADNLAIDLYSFFHDFFDADFIWDAKLQNKTIKDIRSAIASYKRENGAYMLTMKGVLKNERIKSKTALRQYIQNWEYPSKPSGLKDENPEYQKYYDSNVMSCGSDLKEMKNAILELFSLDVNPVPGDWLILDQNGYLSNFPVSGKAMFFGGEFNFGISCYCLKSGIDAAAQKLDMFADRIQQKYRNVNVAISMDTSWANSYDKIYGTMPLIPKELQTLTGYYNVLLPRLIYLHSPAWSTIVCPQTLKVLGTPETSKWGEKINGDAMKYKIPKDISKTTIPDLKMIKKDIYSLIFPRKGIEHLNRKPRKYWEVIPVFENEIEILQDGVIQFTHHGEMNWCAIKTIAGF